MLCQFTFYTQVLHLKPIHKYYTSNLVVWHFSWYFCCLCPRATYSSGEDSGSLSAVWTRAPGSCLPSAIFSAGLLWNLQFPAPDLLLGERHVLSDNGNVSAEERRCLLTTLCSHSVVPKSCVVPKPCALLLPQGLAWVGVLLNAFLGQVRAGWGQEGGKGERRPGKRELWGSRKEEQGVRQRLHWGVGQERPCRSWTHFTGESRPTMSTSTCVRHDTSAFPTLSGHTSCPLCLEHSSYWFCILRFPLPPFRSPLRCHPLEEGFLGYPLNQVTQPHHSCPLFLCCFCVLLSGTIWLILPCLLSASPTKTKAPREHTPWVLLTAVSLAL